MLKSWSVGSEKDYFGNQSVGSVRQREMGGENVSLSCQVALLSKFGNGHTNVLHMSRLSNLWYCGSIIALDHGGGEF